MGTHFFDLEVAKVIASSSTSGGRVDLNNSFRALSIISFRLSALDSVSNSFGSNLTVLPSSVGSFITLLLVLEVLSSVIFIGDVPAGRRALLPVWDGVAAPGWTWTLTAPVSMLGVFRFCLAGFRAEVRRFSFGGIMPLGRGPEAWTFVLVSL